MMLDMLAPKNRQELFNNFNQLYCIREKGNRGKILHLEGNCQEFFGLPEEDCINKDFVDWVYEEDVSIFQNLASLSDATNFSRTYRIINKQLKSSKWILEQCHFDTATSTLHSLILEAPAAYTQQKTLFNQYKKVLNNVSEAICLCRDLTILEVNNRFEELLGYQKQEAFQLNFIQEFIPTEQIQDFHNFINAIQSKDNSAHQIDICLKNSLGTTFDARIKFKKISSEGEELELITIFDITQDLAVQKALEESQKRYQCFASASQEGIIIHENGVIVEANDKISEIFGAPASEIIGRSLTDLIPKTELPKLLQFLQENSEKKDIKRYAKISAYHSSGKLIHGAFWANSLSIGDKNYRYAVIRDISKEEEALRELEDSHRKYKRLSDITQEMIIVHDNGIIQEANAAAARYYEMSEKEIIGKHIFDITPQDIINNQNLSKEMLEMYYQSEHTAEGIQEKQKNGETIFCKFRENIINDNGRKLRHLIMQNITKEVEANRLIEESRNKFKIFADASQEAISIHRNGVLKEANNTYCELFQLKQEEIEGFSALNLMLPEDRENTKKTLAIYEEVFSLIQLDAINSTAELKQKIHEAFYQKILTTPLEFKYTPNESGRVVLPLLKNNGEIFIAESLENFIVIDGDIYQFQIIRDITRTVRAKEELENSRNKYKLLSDATNEAIVVHNMDGIIKEVNNAYCKLFKTTQEHIIGKTGFEFIPPHEVERVVELMSFAQQNITVENYIEQEEEVLCLNLQDSVGNIFTAEARPSFIVMNNELLRYTVIRDITDIIQTQQLLEESTSKYKRLADATREGIIIHNNGIIVEVNKTACELFGYSEEEMINQSIQEIADSNSFNTAFEMLAQKTTSQSAKIDRILFQHNNGNSFIAEIWESHINVNQEELRYMVIRDITSRIRYEQRIEELVEGLSEKNKQLNGLFELARLASTKITTIDKLMERALKILPYCWQYPDICFVSIHYENKVWQNIKHEETAHQMKAPIFVDGKKSGQLSICYIHAQELETHSFLPSEYHLIETLAIQLGTLLEKKLSEDSVISSILETEDRERTRIAKELHDSLGQLLMAISLNLEALKKDRTLLSEKSQQKFNNAIKYLGDAILESRHISHNLMPKTINDYGYVLAVQGILDGLDTLDHINFHFYDNLNEERLAPKLELPLFRITQEAVTNTLKHADAKNITIQLMKYPDMLILTIEDDGKGFNYDKKHLKKDNFGLNSIQNRANSISGILTIESRKGHGTTIMIEVSL